MRFVVNEYYVIECREWFGLFCVRIIRTSKRGILTYISELIVFAGASANL